jgi:PmbA protein
MSAKRDPVAIATQVVETAVRAGADAADAYVRNSSRLSIAVREGAVESLKRAETFGLGLRVQVDGRTMLVHTTDTERLSLLGLLRRALRMARAMPAPRDPAVFATPGEAVKPLEHPDPGLRSEPEDEKIARLLATERAMLAVAEVSHSGGVSCDEDDGVEVLVNSAGLRLSAPYCSIEMAAEAMAERGDESYAGGRYLQVPARRQLLDSEAIGRDAGRRAVEMLGARPLETTRAPVIFTPYTGWTVLVCLGSPLRADNVVQGRSYLEKRLGDRIAAPGVNIRDNALLPGGAQRRAFDGEGTPCRDLPIIQDGVLESYLTDLASAAQLGVAASGNARRETYNAQPEIATSNFFMEPGEKSPEEIVKETDRGLLLTSLSGWWVGLSPVTGSFSSAAMGFWIEKGEKVHPVKGVTIGGSMLQMLQGIDRIGKDLTHLAPTTTPTFRVREMAIAGL